MRILSPPRFCVAAAWIIGAVLGLPVLCSSALGQSDTPAIDHVRVLVHDIAAAQNTLHALGFEMRRSEPSVYQEGSAHNSAPFSDGTYLELIGIADREKLAKSRPWIVEFLQHYQGAHSVGIIVTSAKDVADRLQSQGIDAPFFTLIGSHPEAKPVLLITPKLANLADGAIFFVEYPSKRSSPAQVSQPNTAQGTIAVWILVKDLEKASKDVERIGFHSGRLLKFDVLGARGREFDIGDGRILLLESDSPGKSAADFSRERGQGVIGLTLSVSDLKKAQSLLEENAHRKLPTYDGIYGKSVLVPAELANGVWIEMVQK
jgi:Glyoxalase-like domain